MVRRRKNAGRTVQDADAGLLDAVQFWCRESRSQPAIDDDYNDAESEHDEVHRDVHLHVEFVDRQVGFDDQRLRDRDNNNVYHNNEMPDDDSWSIFHDDFHDDNHSPAVPLYVPDHGRINQRGDASHVLRSRLPDSDLLHDDNL